MGENLAEHKVDNLEWIIDIIFSIVIIHSVRSNTQVYCPACGEDVGEKDKLPMHLKTVHNYSKPFLCDHPCDKSFATKYNLVAHQSRRTCLNYCQIVCQFCGDKFPNLFGLKEHHRRGKCGKRYQCLECENRPYFSKSFDFKNHREVTHPQGDPGLSENDVAMQLPFVIRYVRWFITTMIYSWQLVSAPITLYRNVTHDWFMTIRISLNHIVS